MHPIQLCGAIEISTSGSGTAEYQLKSIENL